MLGYVLIQAYTMGNGAVAIIIIYNAGVFFKEIIASKFEED